MEFSGFLWGFSPIDVGGGFEVYALAWRNIDIKHLRGGSFTSTRLRYPDLHRGPSAKGQEANQGKSERYCFIDPTSSHKV
jgi:hypothetical protein